MVPAASSARLLWSNARISVKKLHNNLFFDVQFELNAVHPSIFLDAFSIRGNVVFGWNRFNSEALPSIAQDIVDSLGCSGVGCGVLSSLSMWGCRYPPYGRATMS